jgi:hypothetical protein
MRPSAAAEEEQEDAGAETATTNGNNSDPSDDSNPGLFTSTRWYGVRLGNGALGFISKVWIDPSRRGLGLPGC